MTFELDFTEREGGPPKLVRTRFECPPEPGDDHPRQSTMRETHEPGGDSFHRFKWTKGVKGLAVLFLHSLAQQQRGLPAFTYRVGESDYAAALLEAVRRCEQPKKNAWLRKMFASSNPRKPGAKGEENDLLWHSLFEFEYHGGWVALDKDKWAEAAVTVRLNEKTLTAADELDGLADRIEGKQPAPPLDLLVRDPATGQFTSVLEKPALLPVKEGDELQLRVRLGCPAYICLAWVDQQGKPFPMYPWSWTKADWNELVLFDERSEVAVPDSLASTGHSDLSVNGPPGVETLVLMVSHQRPAANLLQLLAKLLSGLPVPKRLPELSQPFRQNFPRRQPCAPASTADRGPAMRQHPDPLRGLHEAIAQRLAEHFDQTVTLSFPNAGPPSSSRKVSNPKLGRALGP